LHQRTPISSSDLSLQENSQLIIAVGTGFVQLEKLDRAFKLVDLFRHRTLLFCGTGNLCIYVSHRLATSRLINYFPALLQIPDGKLTFS
jgi:hypothetical protein